MNQNKKFENYEDSLWRVIMYDFAEHDGKELSDEIAALKDDPQSQPTDAEKIKYYKMLDSELHKNKLRSVAKTSKKILARVAVVVLVFILGFSILYTTVEAFRVQVLNFLLTFDKEYTTVKLGDGENDKNMIAGFKNAYVPKYIPDGFEINGISNNPNYQTIVYKNDDEKTIFFYVFEPSMTTNIDSKNANIIKNIKINGNDAIFVLKKDKITISWSNDEKIFMIYAQISESEAIKIAESVIYIE